MERKRVKEPPEKASNPLLFVSDFSDFPPLSRRSSTSSPTNSSLDSDTRDTLYARFYFSTTTSKPSTSSGSTASDDEEIATLSHSDTHLVAKQLRQSQDGRKRSSKRKRKRSSSKKKQQEEDHMTLVDSDSQEEVEHEVSNEEEGEIKESHKMFSKDDPWRLIEKDVLGGDKYEELHGQGRSRYNLSNLKCDNCRQKGHASSSCPYPKRHTSCYLCAGLDHLCGRCPRSRCIFCFDFTHRGRPCKRSTDRRNHCTRCFMSGHREAVCPEIWRQYHNTTVRNCQLTTLTNPRQTKVVYCSICAEGGHFAFECHKPRPRSCIPSFPLIAKYDEQETAGGSKQLNKRRASSGAILISTGGHFDSRKEPHMNRRRTSMPVQETRRSQPAVNDRSILGERPDKFRSRFESHQEFRSERRSFHQQGQHYRVESRESMSLSSRTPDEHFHPKRRRNSSYTDHQYKDFPRIPLDQKSLLPPPDSDTYHSSQRHPSQPLFSQPPQPLFSHPPISHHHASRSPPRRQSRSLPQDVHRRKLNNYQHHDRQKPNYRHY